VGAVSLNHSSLFYLFSLYFLTSVKFKMLFLFSSEEEVEEEVEDVSVAAEEIPKEAAEQEEEEDEGAPPAPKRLADEDAANM
jgi:hypothetical protein